MNLGQLMPKQLMPYDVYERHQVISQLLEQQFGHKKEIVVLDVGGRIELLARFLPYKIISVNPDGTGAVWGDGMALPFGENAFDAVVNIDTLEHLPEPNRLPFIQECLRVSRSVVLVAAPFGNEGHIALEKQLNDLHEAVMGKPHHYLGEHVENGLPSPAHLLAYQEALQPATVSMHYAGNYIWQGESFARAVRANKKSRLSAAGTHFYNRFINLALFHPINLVDAPASYTNRFYLTIEKVLSA
ncbi:MAG: class I SAM-dependent methyltransferase [Chloroflexota bacterium]